MMHSLCFSSAPPSAFALTTAPVDFLADTLRSAVGEMTEKPVRTEKRCPTEYDRFSSDSLNLSQSIQRSKASRHRRSPRCRPSGLCVAVAALSALNALQLGDLPHLSSVVSQCECTDKGCGLQRGLRSDDWTENAHFLLLRKDVKRRSQRDGHPHS